VQDQPVVRVAAERLRHDLFELGLDDVDRLAGREAGAVADPENVGVDGESFLTERSVENDVRGLAADARKFLEFFSISGDLKAEAIDQSLREGDDVFRLGVEQTDRFDRVSQRFFAQIEHLLRRFDPFEELARRKVHARVGRLGRQDDGDQQLIDVAVLKLGRRRGIGLGKPAEEFENLGAGHDRAITSRIE
jgi:hypothetical protein